MRIKHNDKDYLIQFTKQHVVHGGGKNKTDRIRTICRLFLLDKNVNDRNDRVQLSWGQVTQFHADQYDKIIGKKLAMMRMLAKLAISMHHQNKEFRTKAWKGFHEIFGAWNQSEKRRVNEASRLKKALDEIKELKNKELRNKDNDVVLEYW